MKVLTYDREERVRNRKKDILSGMKLKKGLNIDQIFRKTYKQTPVYTNARHRPYGFQNQLSKDIPLFSVYNGKFWNMAIMVSGPVLSQGEMIGLKCLYIIFACR